MKYKMPRQLHKGDTIEVIAPCSAADKDKVKTGIEYLKNKGFIVKTADNLSEQSGYMAGSDEYRISSFNEFWADNEVKAIFAVRGGYGAQRLLTEIDYNLIGKNPKIFVGYSDISALSSAILAKSGVITFSGPMVASDMGENFDIYSEDMLWRMLMGQPTIENPAGQPLVVYKKGSAEGYIFGGTLTVLLPYLGTSYVPDLEGAILVVEDVGENIGKLDRHFHQLRYQGVFDKISGLVLGEFTDCFDENVDPIEGLQSILDSALKGYEIPVVMNFAYGHIKKRVTLPIGSRAILTTDPPKIRLIKSVEIPIMVNVS